MICFLLINKRNQLFVLKIFCSWDVSEAKFEKRYNYDFVYIFYSVTWNIQIGVTWNIQISVHF